MNPLRLSPKADTDALGMIMPLARHRAQFQIPSFSDKFQIPSV